MKRFRDTLGILGVFAIAILMCSIAYSSREDINETTADPCNQPNCHCLFARNSSWTDKELEYFKKLEEDEIRNFTPHNGE
jgi:hypothetical protein